MPPAARIGDMHVCPMVTPGLPPVPHVGSPITMGVKKGYHALKFELTMVSRISGLQI